MLRLGGGMRFGWGVRGVLMLLGSRCSGREEGTDGRDVLLLLLLLL
jgi:hypothetical protein